MTYSVHRLTARWYHAGGNRPVKRIVVHTAEVAPVEGAARGVARYFATVQDRHVSAHGVIDAAELWRCVDFGDIAYHAPPNQGSVGLELACRSNQSPEQWAQPDIAAIVDNAGAVVADWCDELGVPKRWLNVDEVRAGVPGICGHVTVSEAFHQTNHTDPGVAFPVARFMLAVTGHQPPPIGGLMPERLYADESGQDNRQVWKDEVGKVRALAAGETSAALQAAGVPLLKIGHADLERLIAEATD